MENLRPAQRKILQYSQGKMGISAVPGSGKTWTLSRLAAAIIERGELDDEQEVLVVTLVNSAVDNFHLRVSSFVEAKGLLPSLGYRVRTLHGLANDIVRGRPDLAGLADNFQIVDEREANAIRQEAARAWLLANPYALDDYLKDDLDESRREWLRRDILPDLVSDVSSDFIRYAKDKRLTPARLQERMQDVPFPMPLAEMGCAIYADYQQGLQYRGAVDFDDLIRLALDILETDPGYLERLQELWPFFLEDEAQDSSRLQERILALLAGGDGNWVRVGDPNQAIFETFTTADPQFLKDFIQRKDVLARELPNSGRSTQSIIGLANYLVEWTQENHPQEKVRNALSAPPWIEPTLPGDPQQNPIDDPNGVHIVAKKFTPQEEVEAVVNSLARWLPEHPESTVAVLTPRNQRGFEVVDQLRARDIPYVDSLLRSSSSTRFSAGALANLLNFLAEPTSVRKLSTVYRVWRRGDRDDEIAREHLEHVTKILRTIPRVEDYLWPGPESDWLLDSDLAFEDPITFNYLLEFRELVRRWSLAVQLPVDQLALTLAQDLLVEPAELAIAHKLALLLRQANQAHPEWRLPELIGELAVIARNERRFLGFGEEDRGFDPVQHRGKVVVATMHKAKGLEWERVYLMSVNNYDFPSADPYDRFIAERWFLRDQLNLGAETLAQLDAILSPDVYNWYQEGEATYQARLDYVRERLRLLYVGITRAERELVITWNSGRKGDMQPAAPLLALLEYWYDISNTEEII